MKGDLHEFQLTKEGTALLSMYERMPADLSVLGGSAEGWILDSLFQEVDVETGDLLFEWRASDYHAIHETMRPFAGGKTMDKAFDFYHINSIDKDDQGNYYISSRYMQSITCISPAGEILWTLGGRKNDLTDLSDGAATNFMWQHHARLHENHTMTIFDNGKCEKCDEKSEYSRAMQLSLDLDAMTVTLLREYSDSRKPKLAQSQGSAQLLESGNMMVGWGFLPAYTEFTPEGKVMCDVQFGPTFIWGYGMVTSYRTHKSLSWVGQPQFPPETFLNDKLYVSWNGATEIDSWVLQGCDWVALGDDDAFFQLAKAKKQGFETAFKIASDMPRYMRVLALDKSGKMLGETEIIDRHAPRGGWSRSLIIVVYLSALCALLVLWVYRRSISRRCKGLLGGRTWRILSWKDRRSATEHERRPLYSD